MYEYVFVRVASYANDAPPPHEAIQSLTQLIRTQLSTGTIDAPSWEIVRVSKTATRMYAPLGTRMTLGDWVRVVRTFVGGFSHEKTQSHPAQDDDENQELISQLVADLNVRTSPQMLLGHGL